MPRPSFLLVVAAGLLAAGCATAPPAATGTPTPAPTPTSTLPDAVTACTSQLVYWAGEDLRGAPDQGFDYQHRGISSAQNDALRVIVEEARALGDALPPDQVQQRARAACAALTP